MDPTSAEQRRAAAEQAKAERAERRARVLRHPDLVARLREVIDPDSWTGYIPPARNPEDACDRCPEGTCRHRDHTAPANRSYYRRTLVAIAAEALRREQQPTLDESGGE